ncbi:hypothetical protein GZH53_17295 [Flavihumibacter sp. R14]|nr:hypothetical protein [Flavihumibacter soli]
MIRAYNQILNAFWTVLAFIPVLRYWINYYSGPDLFWILGVSMVPLFLPASWFDYLQFSRKRSFYESIGIRKMQAFTQDGYLVNQLIRRTKPGYRTVRSRRDYNSLRSRMLVYEKFHWACFDFFLLTFCLALREHEYGLAAFILLANLFYNLVPVLIQQYIRVRMGF